MAGHLSGLFLAHFIAPEDERVEACRVRRVGYWPSLSCPRLQASRESGAPCPCLEQDACGQAHPLQETPPPDPTAAT